MKRLILLIPVMIGVSLVTFILSMSIGDPIASYIGEGSERLSDERIEAIREELGLNEPWYVQYFRYVERLVSGDWGVSPTMSYQPVTEVIASHFPATAELSIFAMIFAIAFGIPLGIISAVKKDKLPDQISRVTALSGVSMPIFWLGLMVQILIFNINQASGLSVPFHERWSRNDYSQPETILFGSAQATGFLLIDSLLQPDINMFIDVFLHLLAPAFCLAWLQMAIITRMTRMAMIETMREDFILLARSKGLTERIIIYRHALRNAIIPTLTVAGLALAGLLGGAVLTETIFDWPGIGRWAVDATASLDLAAIQGFVIISAIIYVLSNLAVDLLYGYIDPRIRYD